MRTILVHFRNDLPDSVKYRPANVLTVGTADDSDVETTRELLAIAKRQAAELREQGFLARLDVRHVPN